MQVKHRMRNREQYQDFLKCLSLFSEDIISKGELLSLVADSLSRHPDLAVCASSLPKLCMHSNMIISGLQVMPKCSFFCCAELLQTRLVTLRSLI